ncbi:MAG: hypothetical protein J6O55_07625 [Lachnospiraceae bacterium]|nr:hypothetical protein [Lachnospiraceae bacterium]
MDNRPTENGILNMTHTGILKDRNGKDYVCVRFERKNAKGGTDYTEMRLPPAKVMMNQGFKPDELKQMAAYLKENEGAIKEKARSISSFLHIFGNH